MNRSQIDELLEQHDDHTYALNSLISVIEQRQIEIDSGYTPSINAHQFGGVVEAMRITNASLQETAKRIEEASGREDAQ